MYLQQLYKQNKWWFLFIMLFIAGQLFINYKRGVVFSPFFHYGMYSEVIPVKSNYTVTEIFVNGERLATKDFTPQQWDNLTLPVKLYNEQQQWNSQTWQQDVHRLLPFTDSTYFLNGIEKQSFRNWYRQRLQAILKRNIDSFYIQQTDYFFDGNTLINKKQSTERLF